MKKRLLIFNYWVFKWYYKRCGEHFKQWPFQKSVILLIQNYHHLHLLLKNAEAHNRNLTKDNDEMRKQLFDIKMKHIASDSQIDWINDFMGTDIHKNNEN